VIQALDRMPPRLVIFRPNDKYNTSKTAEVMTAVSSTSSLLGEHDGAKIYRR
jgi:hypothetical protein